jgi:hypothetical protein
MKIFLPILFLTISIPEYAQTVQKVEFISAKSEFVKVNTLKFKPVKKINPIEYFNADKDSITVGERAILKWAIKNEGNVRIEVSENQQDYTLLSSSSSKEGTLIVSPAKTSYYRIIASESTKMFALKVVEKVLPLVKVEEKLPIIVESPKAEAVIQFFKSDKTSIRAGEKVKLEWLVNNVLRVSLEFGDSVEKAVFYKDYLNDNFEFVTPQKTTIYVLRIGDIIKTVKIEVAPK